jgi:hypothetical protein
MESPLDAVTHENGLGAQSEHSRERGPRIGPVPHQRL